MELNYCDRVIKSKYPMFDVVKASQNGLGQILCEGLSEREFHSVMVKRGNIQAYCRFADLKPKTKVELFYDYDCKNKIAIDPVRSEILTQLSSKILVKRVVKKKFLIGIDGSIHMC